MTVKRGLPAGISGSPVPYRVGGAEDSGIISILKNTLIGFFSALLVGLLGVTAATAVAYANADPDSIIKMIFWIPPALSFFTGGMVSGKLTRSNPLLCGLLPTAYLLVSFLLIGIFFPKDIGSGYTLWQLLLLGGGLVLVAFGGSFVGAREKKTKAGKFKYKR